MTRRERLLWMAGAAVTTIPWGNPKGTLLFLLMFLVPLLFYVFVVTPNVVRPIGVILIGAHLWLWVVIVRSESPVENRAFVPLAALYLDTVVVLVLGFAGAAIHSRGASRRDGFGRSRS